MSVRDPRAELCEVIEQLYRSSLITATGGNVSLRCPDAPEHVWITPTGLYKGALSPDILVKVDLAGNVLDDPEKRPSSEAPVHLAILRARPDVQAVIHCHAPYATILANAELPFLPISTESAFVANLGRIPFVMPGTPELASAVTTALGKSFGVLMQNHGLMSVGRTLRRAADIAEIIERTAQVIWGCYAVGRPPPVLPPEVVCMLQNKDDLSA